MNNFIDTVDLQTAGRRLKKVDYKELTRGILAIVFGVMMLVQIGNLLTNRAIKEINAKTHLTDIRYINTK